MLPVPVISKMVASKILWAPKKDKPCISNTTILDKVLGWFFSHKEIDSTSFNKKIFQLFKCQPNKMVKHTQTIRRQFADEFFECVWPFCGICAERVNISSSLPVGASRECNLLLSRQKSWQFLVNFDLHTIWILMIGYCFCDQISVIKQCCYAGTISYPISFSIPCPTPGAFT